MTRGVSSNDQWGVSFLYSSMSQASFDTIDLYKRKDESLVELTYKIVFNQYFSLQPDIQYIMNPIEGVSDALVVGTRLTIDY